MSSGGNVATFDAAVRELLRGGYTARFRATGDSMDPAIRNGEYVHVEPCAAAEVRRGQILLIDASRGLTAHRLVRMRRAEGETWLITRGDNSLRNDPPARAAQLLGKVIAVERDGQVTLLDQRLAMRRYARTFFRRVLARLQRLSAR